MGKWVGIAVVLVALAMCAANASDQAKQRQEALEIADVNARNALAKVSTLEEKVNDLEDRLDGVEAVLEERHIE